MVFRIASSPYTHNQRQTSRIMMLVCLAALPGIAVQCWFFGWGTLFQIILGCASALAAEALVLKLRKAAVSRILADNSALLTGLLLAISIPPFAPWWMVVLGTVFAVIIAKQLYGGGHGSGLHGCSARDLYRPYGARCRYERAAHGRGRDQPGDAA